VVVIAATNRPDIVDPALLRPGRFDRLIDIPPPDREARKAIFRIHTARKPLAEDVSLEDLAEKTDGYTGADIAAVCNEAVMLAIREYVEKGKEMDRETLKKDLKLRKKHFEEALKKLKPMSKRDVSRYTEIAQRFEEGLSREED